MEAVGRLAGGVAHDFNNILTAIIGYSELLEGKFAPNDPRLNDMEEIHRAAERAASLTRQLLAFSRKQIFAPRVLNLNNLIQNLDKMLRRLLSEDIKLVTIPEGHLGEVLADPGQLEQVIINLAVNARDAMPRGGVITIETQNVFLDEDYAQKYVEVQPGDYVMMAVSDTGSGMTKASRTRIFEPFFTTKELGKGTGLGLSTVHGIIKQSGGHITVYSEVGQGATFKVYLPRLRQQVQEETAAATSCTLDRGTETILLVEDEDLVRQVARRILEIRGYTMLEAASGPDALQVSQKTQGPIHLMLTDVVMPGMSGGETAELLQRQRPELKVLFMSGHTENSIVHHGVLDPGVAFIQKPFRSELLVRKVRQVLDQPLRADGLIKLQRK
jgi:CheY-like chemotaxis protein